jgi:hypothetical protein
MGREKYMTAATVAKAAASASHLVSFIVGTPMDLGRVRAGRRARPSHAIAATLSRILLYLLEKGCNAGHMPLSPQKTLGANDVRNNSEKYGPSETPEKTRPIGRAKEAYVYEEGVVEAEADKFSCSSVIYGYLFSFVH